PTAVSWPTPPARPGEALTLPTQVNFVAKGVKLSDCGYQTTGTSQVVRKYLNTSWLWDKVRVQGGAYGGFCGLDRHSTVMTFTSYRDPNLLETLDVFDRSSTFLANTELTPA